MNATMPKMIEVTQTGGLLRARHAAYEIAWDLRCGGVLVLLRDAQNDVTLLTRAGEGRDRIC